MPATPRWSFGGHAVAFGQYADQGTQRGDRQVGLVDWEMLTATRALGRGKVRFTAMTSIESFINGGNGYPLLLQTGGSYQRGYVHDRQHSHDVLMELSGAYDRLIGRNVTLSLYVAPVGNPALGPMPFMHRPSAEKDPTAPLGHHWQDASHGSHGVATLGLRAGLLTLEGSAFNARESDHDEPWPDFSDAKLDSYAGRMSVGTSRLSASAWWGYLAEHDRYAASSPMHRYGGSVMSTTSGLRGGRWATTAVWAMNLHHHGGTSHAILHGDPNASPHHHASSMLLESTLGLGQATSVFGRLERVMKNGEELGFLGGDLTERYEVRAIAAGFSRDVAAVGRFGLALGARGAVNFVPEELRSTYGTRTPKGFSLFVQAKAR